MSPFVLQANNVTWSAGSKNVIQNIHLQIKTGETVAIVGPNGAGKTSLLKCLYGEHSDYSGNIYLHGKPLKALNNKDIAQKVAVVSQHSESAFSLTVLDIVGMGLIPHKGLFDINTDADKHNIEQALIKVDLIKKQHQLFNTLSGGEQQRVLIARAIVQAPDILIMDEPTNHLDMYYQHQILMLAKSLKITLLITIHDLNLAAQYCDRVVIINNGEIVADDTPEGVFTAEKLTDVFKLECAIDKNPFTQKTRITFAGINNRVNDESKWLQS
ncbi:ABC transporter ATP-binding protein [Pseudocolwellia agarivorans]|uniref:ABC transporter ATP-binding protein n=1 Tax=Pseudocolwellia agarivorans TaxID=1911682 RepID=UPI000986E1CB|nr:ABC transporter ATP-binding protein [Pseudocolwellia agarivorans]